MKALLKPLFSIYIIFNLLTGMAIGQNTDTETVSDDKLVIAAKEIMNETPTCALITLDESGRPAARAMDAFAPEDDMSIWFGTNPLSRKVSQINKDSRVTLYYIKNDASGYVVIQGTAQIVDDPQEKEEHWKNEWTAFYPNYPEDYLLIKVTPQSMEVISYAHGITGDTVTWETPRIEFTDRVKEK